MDASYPVFRYVFLQQRVPHGSTANLILSRGQMLDQRVGTDVKALATPKQQQTNTNT